MYSIKLYIKTDNWKKEKIKYLTAYKSKSLTFMGEYYHMTSNELSIEHFMSVIEVFIKSYWHRYAFNISEANSCHISLIG